MTATEALFLLAGLGLGVLTGGVVERRSEGRKQREFEKKVLHLQAKQRVREYWEEYKKRQGPTVIE